MRHRKPKLIFVAGTDTDVGKTYVSALAAEYLVHLGRRVGVYKPVASGCPPIAQGELQCVDASKLWEAAQRPGVFADVCPQTFSEPLAPPEAARCEGRRVDTARLVDGLEPWLDASYDVTIIEGAGGLFSPIADDMLNIDLAKKIKPDHLVVVAANRLGVIHQVIATVRAAAQGNVHLAGLILSCPRSETDSSVPSNADQLARHVDVPVLANIKHHSHFSEMGFLEKLVGPDHVGRCDL